MTFLDIYRQYAEQVTDAPIEFHKFLAIVTAGVQIGRARYLQFGHQRIYPNFYIIILAPSSFYRKSTALDISKWLTYNVNSEKCLPSDFTQEKIVEILETRPQGIFYYFEFKSLMGMLGKEYNSSLKSFLTELFDCNPIEVARKAKTTTVEEPCISIASASTPEWLIENIKSGDIQGGFLARFIFVYSKVKPRNDAFPVDPDETLKISCDKSLRSLSDLQPAKMILSDIAKKYYVQWYQSFTTNFDSMPIEYRTLFSRLNIYALKMGIVITAKTNTNILIHMRRITERSYYKLFAFCLL